MDITYYAFATYVFLLVCGGIWFFTRVSRGGKAKGGDKSAYEKEQRLFTLYQNVEEMLAGFEELAEETKKDVREAMKKAEDMLEEARRLSARGKAAAEPATATPSAPRGVAWDMPREEVMPEAPEAVQPAWETPRTAPEAVQPAWEAPRTAPEDRTLGGAPLKMNEKALLLSAQGLSPTEIAKTLGVSVREVTLALEMGRK
jgi:hypothetical protein